MTTEAEVGVVLRQHFPVDGTVRVVTGGTTFAQRGVLERHRTGLLAMALGAAFIQPRHRQPARRFEDVAAVRIVALDAIHAALDYWMMVRQLEFNLRFQVTPETGDRFFARIDDEFSAATADFDVPAARAVTGLAAGFARQHRRRDMDPAMGAGGKSADVIGVAGVASLVADVMRAGNFQRGRNLARQQAAGIAQRDKQNGQQNKNCAAQRLLHCGLRDFGFIKTSFPQQCVVQSDTLTGCFAGAAGGKSNPRFRERQIGWSFRLIGMIAAYG